MRVDDLLTEKNIDFKVTGRDYVVKCLNPEHDDKNPAFYYPNTLGL